MLVSGDKIRIDLKSRKVDLMIPDAELARNSNFVLAVNAQIPSDQVRQQIGAAPAAIPTRS